MDEHQRQATQLKVVSDGTLMGTKVINQETGENLEVVSFKIECGPHTGFASRIWIELPFTTPIEVVGSLQEASLERQSVI